jgi:hypothetical protein
MSMLKNNASVSHDSRPGNDQRRRRAHGAAAWRGVMSILVASASGLLLGGCGASTSPGHSSQHAGAAESSRSHISKSVDARISQSPLSAADLARIHRQAQVHNAGVTLQSMLAELRSGGGNAALAAYALCKRLLSPAARAQLLASTHANECEAAATRLLERPGYSGPLVAATKGQLTEVQTHGSTAAATFQLPHQNAVSLRFVNEHGSWRLAALK